MSHDPGMYDPINVSAGEITVEKSFAADEFPVPAIKFVITSDSTDRVDIRLTDNVPESFPMDCVGFHPDYDNDHWTAYQDHRVEFVHTLEPNQELTTVYGIRLDEADVAADAFLDEPYLDLKSTNESGGSEAEGVEDIVGADNNEVVRDVLSGESEAVPGMEEEESVDPLAADEADPEVDDVDGFDGSSNGATDGDEEPLVLDDPLAEDDEVGHTDDTEDPLAVADADEDDDADDVEEDLELNLDLDDTLDDETADAPEPRPLDDETLPAIVERPEDAAVHRRVDDTVSEDEDDIERETPDAATASVDTDTDVDDVDQVDESPVVDDDADADQDDQATTSVAAGLGTGGIAAALATEIRNDRVDDDDLAVLKRELDIGVPNSVDVRIHRLQSQMEDLEAYSDALAEFLDEEGTGEQLISDFRSEVEALSDSLGALEAAVDGAEADRADLRHEVDDVGTAVTDVETRIDATEDELSTLADEVAELATVADDVDALGESVDSLDAEMGEVRADVADVDGAVVETREDLEEEVADLRTDIRGDIDDLQSDLDDIHADIEELDEFRNRLGSAFGGN